MYYHNSLQAKIKNPRRNDILQSNFNRQMFVKKVKIHMLRWALAPTCIFNSGKRLPLRKKCPYSVLFWSVLSRIRTEYGEILRSSTYLVRMRENTDQNNSKYRHFSCSVHLLICTMGKYEEKMFSLFKSLLVGMVWSRCTF